MRVLWACLIVCEAVSKLASILNQLEQVAPLTYRAVVVRPEDERIQCNAQDPILADPVLCLRITQGYGQYEFRIHTHSRPFQFLSRLEDRKRMGEDWGDITRLSPETELNSRAALWKQVDYLWRRVIEHAAPDVFFLHALAGNCGLVEEVFKGSAVRPRVLMLPVDWTKTAEEKPDPLDDEEVKEDAFWGRNFQCSINDLYKAIPREYGYVTSVDGLYAIFARKDLIKKFEQQESLVAAYSAPVRRVCDEDSATRGMGSDHAAFIFSAFADPKDCLRSCLADKDCTFWTYSTETLYCWNWGDRTMPESIVRPFDRWHGGACRDQKSHFDSLPVLGFFSTSVPVEISKYKRGFCAEEDQVCYCIPPFAGVDCQDKFHNKESIIVRRDPPVLTGETVREIVATRTPTIVFCDNPEIFIQEVGNMPFAFAHGIWVYPLKEAHRFAEIATTTTVRAVETRFA